MTDEEQANRDQKRIDDVADALGEYFDTVQIFTTATTAEGTRHHTTGRGNWHARYGHIREWLIRAEEEMRIKEREIHRE